MGAFGWTVVGVVVVGGGWLVHRAVQKREAFARQAGIFLSQGGSETYRANVAAAKAAREGGRSGPIPIAPPGGIFVTGHTAVEA